MARYIVLEVDDDKVAEALVKKLAPLVSKGVRLAGLFARPTRWCKCPHPSGYHANQVAQGSKYGWWVCLTCKRPRMGSHNTRNLVDMAELPLPEAEYAFRVDNLSIFEVPVKNVTKRRLEREAAESKGE